MRKPFLSNAVIYALMCLATIGVTVGIAMTLYGPEERTPSFILSLSMLCFAEAILFGFPIYHARASVNRSAPSFAFGFGFQGLLVAYAAAVVALCLLSDIGTLRYSLVERPAFSEGVTLKSAQVLSEDLFASSFDGSSQTELTRNRQLLAGTADGFQLEAMVQANTEAISRLSTCQDPHRFLGRTELIDPSGTFSQECIGMGSVLIRAGPIEIRKALTSPPVPLPNAEGLYQLKYRIEVRNARWIFSFRTLAISHAVLFLLLVLIAGLWRMGSRLATESATDFRAQRLSFSRIQAKSATFTADVSLDESPEMKPFVAAVKKLNDDFAYSTPESVSGAEEYNESLMTALERLRQEYARIRILFGEDSHEESSTLKRASAVQALADSARAVGNLLRERDEAIRAAR